MTLEEFLNCTFEEEFEYVEIPRIHLVFKLKPISAKVSQSIATEVLMEYKRKSRTYNANSPEVANKTMDRLLLASIVEPDLLDQKVLQKANVIYPEDFLSTILRPGEYDLIVRAYSRLNRATNLSDEMIQEAKN